MPDTFDPYQMWLGISPQQQPLDHYRLLGVRVFEDDLDAIGLAVDERKARLATFAKGRHATLVEKLLAEVVTAGECLLSAQEKAAYDRKLRQSLKAEARPNSEPTRTSDHPDPAEGKPSWDAATKTHCVEQLGDYQLIEKLGEGGMGAVYKARHTNLDRLVALKVLPKDRMQSDQAVARFEREMKAVGRVDHPNVVRALDARNVDGARLLVMELVEGLDLEQLVAKSGPIGVADACEIIRQAALGLQAAHEKGLVHRDVKPSNLMLTLQGQVKVLDLGLARFQHDEPPGDEITTGGHVFGTVAYMAPEQATNTHTADIRADIYGLGCTLYKLLTGRAPFGRPKYASSIDILTGHARDPVPPIHGIRSDVPDELAQLLDRMLAKKPKERFATPVELADAIGPLSTTSDLASAVAQAEGKPSAAPNQAFAVTQSPQTSTSSALTRMFDQIKGDKERSPIAATSNVSRKRRQTPAVIGLGVAAIAITAAVTAWFVLSNGPQSASEAKPREKIAAGQTRRTTPDMESPPTLSPQTRLALQWPEADRDGAKIEIDDEEVDLTTATIEATPQQLVLALRPGQHALWIGRRGFQPYTRQIVLADGQSLKLTPEWSELFAEPGTVEPPPEEPKTPDDPLAVEPPKQDPVDTQMASRLAEYEAREAQWAEATTPAEQAASAWDFSAAAAALEAITLEAVALEDEPLDGPLDGPLASRLVGRRDELKRLVELKSRIIDAVNEADPRLKKSDLSLRGQGGQVTEADQTAITSSTSTGKKETHVWRDLSGEAVSELMQRVVDLSSGDDLVASGLLALVVDDPSRAEKCFAAAALRGVDIGPYQATLATAAFARAKRLLDEEAYTEADAALASIETTYALIPWFAIQRPVLDAARQRAKAGIFESEAEALYAEAVGHFEKQQLFDMKPLVEQLQTEYAESRVVTEANAGRNPSFAKLGEAIANLGSFLTVRLDGEGDFTKVQAAIDAAPPNSLIEIQDNGPYDERIRVPREKGNLTLRGGTGLWPVIASAGPATNTAPLVDVSAPQVVLERLSLLCLIDSAGNTTCLAQRKNSSVSVRSCVLYALKRDTSSVFSSVNASPSDTSEFDTCVIIGEGFSASYFWSRLVMKNSIWLGSMSYVRGGFHFENILLPISGFGAWSSGELHGCTIAQNVGVRDHDVVIDCIMPSVSSKQAGARIEFCNVHGSLPFVDAAKPGQGTFGGAPRFVDPGNLVYRLRPDSPCLGKASDGGAVGVRFTPEMVEILTVAFGLRARGAIKFSTKSR